jgi:hypothetical protein
LGADYDFDSDDEYKYLRNTIGGLILLTRGRNRSLKAKPYTEKLAAYATEAVLAQSFTESFYQNNPQVRAHIARMGVDLGSVGFVNKALLNRRASFYNSIAQMIWSKSRFSMIAKQLKV